MLNFQSPERKEERGRDETARSSFGNRFEDLKKKFRTRHCGGDANKRPSKLSDISKFAVLYELISINTFTQYRHCNILGDPDIFDKFAIQIVQLHLQIDLRHIV